MLTSTTIRNFVSIDSKERAAATVFSKSETLVGDGAPEDSFVEKMTLPGKNLDLKAAARLVKSESVQKAVQELAADSENLGTPERAQIETDTGTWTARRQDADTFFLSQSRRDGILDESIEVRAWNFAGESTRLDLKFAVENRGYELKAEQSIQGISGYNPYNREEQMIADNLCLLGESISDQMSLSSFSESVIQVPGQGRAGEKQDRVSSC
ncbi:MAG: hypothetical protein KC800_22230, partial [Candidatus Eremiobacteraeota bacterium]|nr:hypothetical protein [Candidatus Eremiobacteraeota bacterium]